MRTASSTASSLAPSVDFVQAFALPFSAECLKTITGLTNMRFQDMNAWSQGMIDGIANYTGDPAVEARCNAATSGIDAAIDDMVPVLSKKPDLSLLGVTLQAGMPMESVRANIKLAISGGQNEPRDAIAGTVWALLTHPDQLALVAERQDPVAADVRGICALDLADRHVAAADRKTLEDPRRRIRTGRARVPDVRLAPTATKSILPMRKPLTCAATPPRASRSAPARISAPAPGPRAPWSPTSRCPRSFRG